MSLYERKYLRIADEILYNGDYRNTRNVRNTGNTRNTKT